MTDMARQLGVANAGADGEEAQGDVLARLDERLRPVDRYAVR